MELCIGPAITGTAVIISKLAELTFKLANVDDQISVYGKLLAHNRETVRAVRLQIAAKKRSLSCSDLIRMYRALDDSDKVLAEIRDLIEKVRTNAGPDGKLATKQRIIWSLRGAKMAAELDKYVACCHNTMENIETRLLAIPPPSYSDPWAQAVHISVPDDSCRYIWKRDEIRLKLG